MRTPAAREAFETVLPAMVNAFRRAPDPAASINRLDRMLERLPSAINLFRLIEARPALLDLMVMILSHAPTLADALSMRAELLDGLIDATAFARWLARRSDGRSNSRPTADYEQRLDWCAARSGRMRFALGVQIVAGASDPLTVAAGYARVAEAAIRLRPRPPSRNSNAPTAAYQAASWSSWRSAGWAEWNSRTPPISTSSICLPAIFRLNRMDRSRLARTQYYNRLAQRVTAALSVADSGRPAL